jgi:hypothetical protein
MPSLTIAPVGARLARHRHQCRRLGCTAMHRAPISMALSHGNAWIEECEHAIRIVQPDPLVQHPDGEWRFRLPDVVVTGEPFWHRERIGLMYSTATRQIPEFRGRYRGRGRLSDDAEAREGPRVPDQVPGSRGLRDRQRAVPVGQDGRRALRVGREIRARLTILLGRRRREVPGSDHEGAAAAQGSLAQPVSRQRREMDSWDRITN